MNLNLRVVICFATAGFLFPTAHAQVWSGTMDTNWFSGSNWSGGTIPSSSTDATINLSTGHMPDIAAAGATARTVTVGGAAGSNAVLTIEGGGTLITSGLNSTNLNLIGGTYSAGATGTGKVTVTGAGSVWTGSSFTDIGVSGTGTLEVLSGGAVNNTSGFRLGDVAGGNGTITVNGGTLSGSTFTIGNVSGGQGTVNISNAGLVSLGSSVTIGGGGVGRVSVSGTGSRFTATGALALGSASGASGTLTISAGASASFTTVNIGSVAGSAGTVIVTGTNSQLTATTTSANTQIVGPNGTGQLILADGGMATFGAGTAVLELGSFSISTTANATLQIGQGGAAGILQAASVNGETASPGTASVIFNHTDAAYSFNPRLTGSLAVFQNGPGTTILNSTSAETYTGGTVVNSGTLQIKASANNWLAATGDITVNGGNLDLGANSQALTTGALVVNGGVVKDGTISKSTGSYDGRSGSISAILSGAAGLNKTTLGTLVLSGSNSYSGATVVSSGSLIGDNNAAFGTSAVTVNGGVAVLAASRSLSNAFTVNGGSLQVDGTLAAGGSLSFGASGGVIKGNGTIAKALTLTNSNQIISPGNGPGTESFVGNQTWNAMTYKWEMNKWNGTTAGTDFDQIDITGSLNLGGASASSLLLDITSLTAGNVAGPVSNFSETNQSWTLLTTTAGISGFSAIDWNLLTGNFSPAFVGSFSISLDGTGNDLVLTYTVPEPASVALCVAGLLMLTVFRRRGKLNR